MTPLTRKLMGVIIALGVLIGTGLYLSQPSTVQPAFEISKATSTGTATPKEEDRVATSSVSISENRVSFVAQKSGTVLQEMNALRDRGEIQFEGKEYPTLGFFVESINGKKNAGGKYWFLYVNGTSSSTGVSSTFVHPGDRVEWRLDKAY